MRSSIQCLIFISLLAVIYGGEELLVTKDFEEQLRKEVTWEVEKYENNIFKGWSLQDFKNMFCGNIEEPKEVELSADESTPSALPEHFDSREKWGHCVHPIRVQGKCGSCWAFATTEAVSDRFCIKGRDVILAPQDLVSCDKSNHACGGGSMMNALNYFASTGCVSEACFPYVSGENGHVPPCPANKCPKSGESWVKHHCQAGTVKSMTKVEDMKQNIYDHGPISTRFEHYQDFTYYKGGVYYHKVGSFICGHLMKTIGWGKESGMDYWILANTYGTAWGEKGFVRFKMHDCGIDASMASCLPKI